MCIVLLAEIICKCAFSRESKPLTEMVDSSVRDWVPMHCQQRIKIIDSSDSFFSETGCVLAKMAVYVSFNLNERQYICAFSRWNPADRDDAFFSGSVCAMSFQHRKL